MRALAMILALLAGCGSLLGIDDFGVEATGGDDVPTDGPTDPSIDAPIGSVPSSLQLGGTISLDDGNGFTPLASNTLSFVSGDAVVATGVSGLFGDFVVEIPSDGSPIDGYCEMSAVSASYRSRAYAFGLATSVTNIGFTAYTDSRLGVIAFGASASQSTTAGAAYVRVVDQVGQPIAFAEIAISGGLLRYVNPTTGFPEGARTTTGSTGDAWIFGAPSSLTVTARFAGTSSTRVIAIPPHSFATLGIRL
ncbi:MAG: hypothetical protein ABI867_29015 [Kofleriaceae bacterium]